MLAKQVGNRSDSCVRLISECSPRSPRGHQSFSHLPGLCLFSQVYFTYISSDGRRRDVKPDTETSCKLQVYDQPFDRGSYRNVHWALVDGNHYVAKRHMGVSAAASKSIVERVRHSYECHALLYYISMSGLDTVDWPRVKSRYIIASEQGQPKRTHLHCQSSCWSMFSRYLKCNWFNGTLASSCRLKHLNLAFVKCLFTCSTDIHILLVHTTSTRPSYKEPIL